MSNLEHNTSTDLAQLRPQHSDEIDLGELIKNLINEWPLIIGITFLGACLGVAAALLIPKEYRVEVVFDKPSNADLAPLLSQNVVQLKRQEIVADFLKNLKSRDLVAKVMDEAELLVNDMGEPLTPEEEFTAIRNTSSALRVAPVTYDFLPELKDEANPIDQISFSILTSEPKNGQALLNGLIAAAERKTTEGFIRDIQGATSVKISKLQTQIDQLESSAIAEKASRIAKLQNALAIAKSLGIEQPQANNSSADLYTKGTRVLEAEIAALNNAKPVLGELRVGFDKDGNPLTITAETLKGELAVLQSTNFSNLSVQYVPFDTKAAIPADAEKPNRKLIAIAATVLAGFLGLFVALIHIAIKNRD